VEQLVASAQAAVDEVVRRGVCISSSPVPQSRETKSHGTNADIHTLINKKLPGFSFEMVFLSSIVGVPGGRSQEDSSRRTLLWRIHDSEFAYSRTASVLLWY